MIFLISDLPSSFHPHIKIIKVNYIRQCCSTDWMAVRAGYWSWFLRWRKGWSGLVMWEVRGLGGLSVTVYQSQASPALLCSGPQLAAYKQTHTAERACLCPTGIAIKARFHRITQITGTVKIYAFDLRSNSAAICSLPALWRSLFLHFHSSKYLQNWFIVFHWVFSVYNS